MTTQQKYTHSSGKSANPSGRFSTRYQRQRRRTGRVRRLEVVLSDKSERDLDIADYLDALPSGTASEFIRAAIMAAIERETAPKPEPEPASEQFNAIILQRIDAIQDALAVQPAQVHMPHQERRQPPEDNAVELDVKTAAGGKSSANFLASLLQLQEHR